MPEKTTYILGAGASKAAYLPTQAELLPLIFSLRPNGKSDIKESDDFLSLELNDKRERILELYPVFDEYRQKLGDFIVHNFASAEKVNQYRVAIGYAQHLIEMDANTVQAREEFLFKAYDVAKKVNVTLEDLFTIFDNVAAGREHFRLYSPENMISMHNQLKLCIIYALIYSIATSCDTNTYRNFAKNLVELRLATSQKDDTLSIITMNWDDLLEQSLYELCNEYNSGLTKNQQRIFPDLCFYNYDLSNRKDHMPSTHIKAKGHKNIKVLKMHGSLSWLECPKCRRIYTDFSREIALDELKQVKCPKCKSDGFEGEDPKLRSLIITPTFMKSLDNLNIKNIWQNAFIDISESDHLIFIGYSFPDADFEMRCLLKKAVKSTADVTVVLDESNNPQKYINNLMSKGFLIEETNQLVNRLWLPASRYKSFFGEDRVKFIYDGFEKYIELMGEEFDEKKRN